MKQLLLLITTILFLTVSCQKENNLLNIPTNNDIESLTSNNESNTNESLSGARTHNSRCNAGFVLQVVPPNRVMATSPLRDTMVNHYWMMGDISPVRTTAMARHMYRPGTYTITHIVTRPAITPTGPSCADTSTFTINVPFQRPRTIVVR